MLSSLLITLWNWGYLVRFRLGLLSLSPFQIICIVHFSIAPWGMRKMWSGELTRIFFENCQAGYFVTWLFNQDKRTDLRSYTKEVRTLGHTIMCWRVDIGSSSWQRHFLLCAGSSISVFGSFVMDMFTASSDLDLSLNVGNIPVERSRSDKISFLRKLTRSLYGLQNGSLFSTSLVHSQSL